MEENGTNKRMWNCPRKLDHRSRVHIQPQSNAINLCSISRTKWFALSHYLHKAHFDLLFFVFFSFRLPLLKSFWLFFSGFDWYIYLFCFEQFEQTKNYIYIILKIQLHKTTDSIDRWPIHWFQKSWCRCFYNDTTPITIVQFRTATINHCNDYITFHIIFFPCFIRF